MEGNVVRVTKKVDNGDAETPSWFKKENDTPKIYRWNARTIREYKPSSCGRTLYYGPYWGSLSLLWAPILSTLLPTRAELQRVLRKWFLWK